MRNLTWAWIMAVLTATSATAEPITFRFTAIVDLFGQESLELPRSGFKFFKDDIVSGRLTFDPAVPDEVPDPRAGSYPQPAGVLTWATRGANYSGGLTGIAVQMSSTDPFSFFYELFGVGSASFVDIGADFASGLSFENDLASSPLLSSDALPTDPDLLMRFPSRQWGMVEDEMGIVRGTITSVSLDSAAPIPEPSTVLLLGGSVIGTLIKVRRLCIKRRVA